MTQTVSPPVDNGRAGRRGPRVVRPRTRRVARPVRRDELKVPHARPATGRHRELEARSAYLVADPSGLSLHSDAVVGGEVTHWPFDAHRPVVRALLLHGPAVQTWTTKHGEGRFPIDADGAEHPRVTADGRFGRRRGQEPVPPERDELGAPKARRNRWDVPVLLLLDASDAPVWYVPLQEWHAWGGVDRPHVRGRRPGRALSTTVAVSVLDRTGWTALLAMAGLPWTAVWSLEEEDLRRVITASDACWVSGVRMPGRPRSLLWINRGAAVVALLLACAQMGYIPRPSGAWRDKVDSPDLPTLAAWGAILLVALVWRGVFELRRSRGRRRFRARTLLGSDRPFGAVSFLERRRSDGLLEWGIRERGAEAWFPVEGPGAPTALRVSTFSGELHVLGPGETVLSTVLLGSVVGVPFTTSYDIGGVVAQVESVAARLGLPIDIRQEALSDRILSENDHGYRDLNPLFWAMFHVFVSVKWAFEIALFGRGSWVMVPIGAVVFVVSVLLVWPERWRREPVGAQRMLPRS